MRPPMTCSPGRGSHTPQPRAALTAQAGAVHLPPTVTTLRALLFTFPSLLLSLGHEKQPGAQLSTRAPCHWP